MKRFFYTLSRAILVATTLFLVASTNAQESKQESANQPETEIKTELDEKSAEIISNCVEAMGGEMVLPDYAAFVVSGESSTPGGASKTFQLQVLDRQVIYSTGGWDSVFDGTWSWVSHTGNHRLADISTNFLFHHLPFPMRALGLKEFSGTAKYIGQAEMQGSTVSQVSFAETESDIVYNLFFDVETDLLVGLNFEGSKLNCWYSYSEIDGVQLVTEQKMIEDGTVTRTATMDYDFRAEVSKDLFEMPEAVKRQIEERKNDSSSDK